MLFPTNKLHISYSEIKCWKECSYRHKLQHIEKIDLSKSSPHLFFGTTVHAGCESFLNTGKIDREKLFNEMKLAWKENDFENPSWYSKQPSWYKHHPVEIWCQWADQMWDELPDFLNNTFPGWEFFKAEEKLYESIDGKDLNFKGFIDGVIKIKNKKGKDIYWILDWKTAPKYGWRRSKKQDIAVISQLALYKKYWSIKHSVPLEDIRCGFILLKREASPGKTCDLVSVSVGPTTLDRSVKIMNNMIYSVRKGTFLKNRDSCMFCAYKDTKHCT